MSRQCDITRSANALARKARVCEFCAATFTEGTLSSKQRAAGHVQRFCSRACLGASVRVYANKAEAKKAEAARARERRGLPAIPAQKECRHCRAVFPVTNGSMQYCSKRCGILAADATRIDRQKAAFTPSTFICRECGSSHTTEYGAPSTVYCSAACCNRSNDRAHKSKRRARLLGVKVEAVNPTVVFDRDGWRCHLCGVTTPRRLRGTCDPRAPELDHIVPLAKGGEHSYRNVACCCRACNGAKGAEVRGQMLLFG